MEGVRAPQVIGRYAIYGKIASGGMASVHFGRLLGGAGFSRTVAIKRLHPHLAENREFRATLIDEARMAARIHHPNVVPTLDVVTADGELLLVMEYVRGESLARLVKIQMDHQQLVPLPVTSAIVVGALHGLHAAHEATNDHGAPLGIVHRDVSPQNILVGVDGMARVIDFGVARATGRLQTTREGTIKGKIAYMAPEQLGGRDVTRAADVYAMGVVLWEALTCRRLFSGDNEAALVNKVLAGPSGPPSWHVPNLSPELDALVMRALAHDPTARFATAREMAEVLLRVVPPAFPTDVGAWCERAASESLAKRETLLAEIESSSGMGSAQSYQTVAAVRPRPGDMDLRATLKDPAGPQPGLLAEAGGGIPDGPPGTTSQPSSLSMEAPLAAAASPRQLWRAVLAGSLLAGVLFAVGLVVALWGGWKVIPSAGPAPATRASAEAPPLPAPAVTSASAAPPAVEAPAPSTAAPPSAAVSAPPSPAAAPPPTPQRTAAPAAAPKPRSTTNCDPNFYYDDNGDKHFKPECFAH
jgi:serine/threonine-protein kinase